MNTIIPACSTTIAIIGMQKFDSKNSYRKNNFCISDNIGDKVLFHNLMTKELIVLTETEYSSLNNCVANDLKKLLIERWFFVPQDYCEWKITDQIKTVYSQLTTNSFKNFFRIYTTTDCNARCYYCYQKGIDKMSMTRGTAIDVAMYIIRQSKGNGVFLSWFGGEPLYNSNVISVICDELKNNGIRYNSDMITNGYLFDKKIIDDAVNIWNLIDVRISLDGTEDKYNKVKSFIYNNRNPFKRVYNNIGLLLKAGIKVCVRFNINKDNADNVMMLANDILRDFSKYDNLSMSVGIITPNKDMKRLTSSEWTELYKLRRSFEDLFELNGVLHIDRLETTQIMNQCMMDNDTMVTILPDGRVAKCDNNYSNVIIGSVNSEIEDTDTILRLKESRPHSAECDECSYYPNCIELINCPSYITWGGCSQVDAEDKISYHKRQMRYTYKKWMKEIHDKTS